MEQLYAWIQDLTVYLIMVTAVMQVIPGKDYKKYIRFFTGLVLILLILTPVLKLTGMYGTFGKLYQDQKYEMEQKEKEALIEKLEETEIQDIFPEQIQNEQGVGAQSVEEKDGQKSDRIRVEEIEVGG